MVAEPTIDPALDPTASPWRDLAPGSVVDGFRLGARLHRGGMATLWEVSHPQHEGPLVMKVPLLRYGEDPATIVGFEVEQMMLPRLSGPHVPRFVAQGELTRRPYIVMERIEGPSLEARAAAAPLAADEVIEIGARVARALHDLHRQHVVHLDVRPENLLQRADGTVVIVDFGLSHHDELPDLLAEEFRQPMGSWPYIAPEQLDFVRDDPRSDVFGLGAVLYQLTTGALPFGDPKTVRELQRRRWTDPLPPVSRRADCPPWLQEIILRCLEVDPVRRWPSAAHLAISFEDPRQVRLTERAARRRAAGLGKRLRRRFAARPALARLDVTPRAGVARRQIARNPIIVAAVDPAASTGALAEALRATVRLTLVGHPGARLACVGVLKTKVVGLDDYTDGEGRNLHLKSLAALKAWAQPLALALDEGQVTFHVLEASDPAAALVEFARRNGVDQIVMGARAASALRRYLGSVSARVVAEAGCTVTVVRA